MIEASRLNWGRADQPGTRRMGQVVRQRRDVLRFAAEIGLLGMLILSPVQFMALPFNLAPVEIWNVLTLPFAWMYLIRSRETVRLPYGAAMWLVFLGSFVGMFAAPHPQVSMTAIVKDIYLYVWFVTVAGLLCVLGGTSLRRVLMIWLAVELLHGVLVIAQFLSPDVFRTSAILAERFGALDQWRPSGLFENANTTGLYQAMGFVPLALIRPSKTVGSIIGTLLLLSIVATGSMATALGFLIGLSVAVVAVLIASRQLGSTVKSVVQLAAPALLLAGVACVVISLNADLSAHFQYIFYGRAEGSADGRFSLWDRGLQFLADDSGLWGIGPDSYREVDLAQKPLHNDLLAFAVERGVIGALGLLLLVAVALRKAIGLIAIHGRFPDRAGPTMVVFLAATVAAVIDAQFHQDFHSRSIWLVLAVQEAVLLGIISSAKKPELSLPANSLDRRRSYRHAMGGRHLSSGG